MLSRCSSIIMIVLAVMAAGCAGDAPHDNPLDPASPSYAQTGTLYGTITLTGTSIGVSGATVTDLARRVSVKTDSLGHFNCGTLSAGDYRFMVEKTNCTSDTFGVTVVTGQTLNISRSLNAAPVVSFQQILTRKIDLYFPSPQYFVEVSARIADPNGGTDFDSAWFSFDTLKYPLLPVSGTDSFTVKIDKYKIPTNTIQYLVGKSLTIIARDDHGAVSVSTPFYVTRVIENEATPLSPSPFTKDTVRVDSLSFMTFTWTPPSVTFNYSYDLTLSRVDAGVSTVVWTKSGIGSFSEEQAYEGAALAPANYVWSITVVDEFGNYGRSKESAFVIK